MDINKPIVITALENLSDSFTVGELVDAILEADKNSKEWVFYHPKVMTTERILALSVVKTNAQSPIWNFNDHLSAIHSQLNRMIEMEVLNENGKIDRHLFKELCTKVNESLNERTFESDSIWEVVEIIMSSQAFNNFESKLKNNWATVTALEISDFYSQLPHFSRVNKEKLTDAKNAFNDMNIENYLMELQEILDEDESFEDD